ncbi:unnamed protein product [Schistosoma rodhaini]|uniref:Uncharacterized protein n=1 Tax=Schistosoma rodhaini TaxID=6188 RepID=A0AA85FYD6_9TREM|nr:unnamed protein product [Schistosoma rodhaini]CAH8658387.1 unnamed protein product [Schistosoma rodhaini]
MNPKLLNQMDLYRKSKSILGPNETQLTMKSLQIEETQRQHFLRTINQRKHQSYPINFHYDQLLAQLIKEDGHIEVNNLMIPKSTVNQQTYRWDELSNPTALNKSIQLRRIRHIHDCNNIIKNNNNTVQIVENIFYPTNNNSDIDMITLNTDRQKSRKRSRISRFSPRCSYIPKEKSSSSISSLDENEIDEVQKKLNNLKSLFIQVKNQINSSSTDNDDNHNTNKIDERLLPNTSTEVNPPKTDVKNTEDGGEKIDECDPYQNLPNYATFSVKKSHEYAVRNWLLSNFNHI